MMDKQQIEEILAKIAGKKWQEAIDVAHSWTSIEPPLDLYTITKIIEHLQEDEYAPAKILLDTILKKNPRCAFVHGIFELYQHVFSSTDMTISEGSEVSPAADTSKIVRVEAETQMTVVDGNVSESTPNPWEMESQALTQVISEESVHEIHANANSQFIDASTITKANKIGPYENLIEIGRGGMGIVYKAYDTQNSRYVALKTIKEEDVPEEIKERFIREMDIVSKLDHPNIIRVYDKFFYNDRMFFSMEFINGHTLKDLRDEGRPFPLEEVLEIVLKICDALEHAHSKGIIHRDLKPSNIMLDINNHVKVVDFGIAKKMGEEKYTRTGQVVGSIQYMPPEQMNGSVKDVDEQSDVYTIGAILYEMIMGVPPFPTPKIKNEMPKTLKTICLRCLNEEKVGRYQSVTGLKRDLLTFSRNLSETKTQRRNKFLLRTVALAIIGALASYSFLLYQTSGDLHLQITQKSTEIDYLREELDATKLEADSFCGEIAYLSGEYQKAIEYYNNIINKKPDYIAIYEKRANVFMNTEQYENAIKDFDIVLKDNNQNTDAYFYCGKAFQALKDYPKAILYYEKVILLDENYRPAYLALAKVYQSKDAVSKAFEYVNMVLEIDKNSPVDKEKATPYYLKGDLYLSQKETLKAVKNIFFGYCLDNKAINPVAKNTLQDFLKNEAIFTRSILLFAQQYGKSGQEYLEKQSDDSGFFEAALGCLHEEEKDYASAFRMYGNAVSKNRNWGYRIARLYLYGWGTEQNQERAKEIFESLARNNDPISMIYLGYMYMHGMAVNLNEKNAFLWFEKAAKLGNFDGMTEAAIMVCNGVGTKKNQEQGVFLLEKAIANYSTKAMKELSKLYQTGNYVMQNKEKAIELREQAEKIELYFTFEENK